MPGDGGSLASVVREHAELVEACKPGAAILADHFAGDDPGLILQRVCQNVGMGHHPDLRALGRFGDNPRQGGQQLGVQARLRFVERD